MRGLWDHEQPLSPSLLRSAMALLGGFLAILALVSIAGGVLLAVRGEWIAAAAQVIGGLAIPFAVWLAVRVLADILTLQHRNHDRLSEMAEGRDRPARAVSAPAGDDGVAYPQE